MADPRATIFGKLRASVERIATTPDDPGDLRLQKTLLVGAAAMMSMGGITWGVFLILFDEHGATAIPFGYTVLTIVNIVVYRLLRNYRSFRFVQLLATLMLPFLLGLALGGYASSGAVVAWSLLAPMGALLFCSPRQATGWFVAFVGVLAIAAALETTVQSPNNLTPAALIVFFAMNLGVPTLAAFVLLRHFVQQKDAAMQALGLEQEKSERLLLNVLPAEIAAALKDDGRTLAERFDAVSVLFADVVGFTRLSEELSPEAMIGLLNEIFSYFDELADKYGVEKIRTIGDNYMVASGAPRRRDDHAQALVAMALEMNDYLARRGTSQSHDLQFRIGINSGPAMAGVIGHHKFHYDLWGDAVNVASRMESHGLPGQIQVGRSTFELIKDQFECEPRGPIEIKGKGMMDTWWVRGPAAV